MYHKSGMPLFNYFITIGLLRNSIQFYTDHTDILTSVETFGHTAREVVVFF